MNLVEITYTKIKYIMRKFPRIGRLSFFIGESKTKRKSGRSMLNQSKEVLRFVFRFKNPDFHKRRTRNKRLWHVFIILEDILKQFKF